MLETAPPQKSSTREVNQELHSDDARIQSISVTSSADGVGMSSSSTDRVHCLHPATAVELKATTGTSPAPALQLEAILQGEGANPPMAPPSSSATVSPCAESFVEVLPCSARGATAHHGMPPASGKPGASGFEASSGDLRTLDGLPPPPPPVERSAAVPALGGLASAPPPPRTWSPRARSGASASPTLQTHSRSSPAQSPPIHLADGYPAHGQAGTPRCPQVAKGEWQTQFPWPYLPPPPPPPPVEWVISL